MQKMEQTQAYELLNQNWHLQYYSKKSHICTYETDIRYKRIAQVDEDISNQDLEDVKKVTIEDAYNDLLKLVGLTSDDLANLDYNFVYNTYRGLRVEDIAVMFEICVKQGVDFDSPKIAEFCAGFYAGIEYARKVTEEQIQASIKEAMQRALTTNDQH